jgi:hypothetical protein
MIRFSQSKVMVFEIATRQLSNITKKKETWRGVCGEQKIATVSIDRARSADPVSNLGGHSLARAYGRGREADRQTRTETEGDRTGTVGLKNKAWLSFFDLVF